MDNLQIFRRSFPDVDVEFRHPASYVAETADAVAALLYSYLFWPDLVECYGAVFIAINGNEDSDLEERIRRPVGDGHEDWPELSWAAFVESYNMYEVPHLFRMLRGPAEVYEPSHAALGAVLREAWEARLAAAYPDRCFGVDLLEGNGSVALRLVVRQKSPELVAPEGYDPRRRGVIGSV
ncbi:hypothetical protein GCM10022243_43930 [Saccharothrix violaceirubra]|uniref:Uncharacterized protein n=1 Tax=Saccharothrix violaceirubra TaxID=413306 RepID=A0A7W7T436_9PSEU|nr:hypothetical protein [Saccharothrix violaceirubra]MBB4965682.1 hypothetical protein [Saccharothrix violaceirubra]